jgi:DNA polymerase elongation subunit (family B)
MSYISAFYPEDSKGYPTGDEIFVWENSNGKNKLKKYPAILEFYTQDSNGGYLSIFKEPLKKHTFTSLQEFRQAKRDYSDAGVKLYESDINPVTKVLMEHYNDAPLPTLNIGYYDIETDIKLFKYDDAAIVQMRKIGTSEFVEEPIKLLRELEYKYQKQFECYDEINKKWVNYLGSKFEYTGAVGWSEPKSPYAPISAISLFTTHDKKSLVMAVPPPFWNIEDLDQSLLELAEIKFYKTEKALLLDFLYAIEDCNVLCGYNSAYYDDPYVTKRVEMILGEDFLPRLSFKHSPKPKYKEVFDNKGKANFTVDFGGRVQLDYLLLLKKFEAAERSSWKLEAISEEFLPHLKKLEYTGTLEQLYNNDFNHFLRYNIRDTEILVGLEEKLGYIALANQMVHENCNLFRDVFGTIKLIDNAIIRSCHTLHNVIVPDLNKNVEDGSISGAFVLYPQIGKHKNIAAIDINSLYPSTTRAINISPETFIGQFVNNMNDWQCLYDNNEKELTLGYDDGTFEIKTTSEWKRYFKDNKFAVSAYGTVFNQNVQGIVPELLERWYTLRKKYNKLKKDFTNKANDLKIQHGLLSNDQQSKYDLLTSDKDKDGFKIKYALLPSKYHKLYEEYDTEAKKNHNYQYTYKILLNSEYGSKTNKHFRFFRLIFGESVTSTGRMILNHQCRQVNKIIEGKYNIDFPLYDSMKTIDKMNEKHIKKIRESSLGLEYSKPVNDNMSLMQMMEKERSENYPNMLSHDIALNGPKFNGKFQSDTIIYGDSVAGNSVIYLKDSAIFIEDLMTDDIIYKDGKEYCNLSGIKALTYDNNNDEICYRDIKYVMRHKCEKQMYRVWTSDNSYIDVTEDHSLMHYDGKEVKKVKPFDHIEKLISFDYIERSEYINIDGYIFFEQSCNRPISKGQALSEIYYMMEYGIYVTIEIIDGFYYIKPSNMVVEESDKCFMVSGVYKVEKIDCVDYVYDIEIDDTHTFFCNNILVSNTDSSYFHIPVDDFNEAVEIADAVADAVNKSYPKFMEKAFFCNDGYKELIQCGREIVASSGIWVGKKLYCARVLDNEGERCDKVKIMGLTLKKTTIPQNIANKLMEFLRRILLDDDWKDISVDLVNYKKELANVENIMNLGLPKSVNNLEDFYTKYLEDSTTFLPGNVSSSIFYNMQLKEYNDNENFPITSGTKIKTYYLKKPILRFRAIALPTDIETIPKWFIEHFLPKLDINMQVEKLVDKSLENILDAIGYNIPSEQSLFSEELFEF